MQLRVIGAALVALILSACATPRYAPPGPGPRPVPPAEYPKPTPPRPEPGPPPERTIPLSALPGWSADDHSEAFIAFRETCSAARDAAMAQVCRSARAIGPLGADDARRFFEANFRAERSPPAGVLTAYFAPEYQARRRPDAEFSAPVRPKPPAASPGQPAPDRTQIETSSPDDALAWMRPEELFFLQIQGSGGADLRRRPADEGALCRQQRAAVHAHRQRHARPGAAAAGQHLGRCDPRLAARPPRARGRHDHAAEPALCVLPSGAGRRPPAGGRGEHIAAGRPRHRHRPRVPQLRRAALAGRRGPDAHRRLPGLSPPRHGAGHRAVRFKGDVRADLYLGLGPEAGAEAGRVRHTLRMYRLVPRAPSS